MADQNMTTHKGVEDAPIYNFEVETIDGKKVSLSQFKGKTLMIVNTASQCGFTPQYAGLETLYQKYKDKGFVVLAFPCNQFGGQEPGSNAEIAEFCGMRFKVNFPVFAKIDVNGNSAHPLYQYLCSALPGLLGTEMIKWNFTKFLVSPQGKPVKRYPPQSVPESLAEEVEGLLA